MANTSTTTVSGTIVFFFFFLLFSCCSYACNIQDKKALIAFKNSFPSTAFLDWTNETDCCFWSHVGCDDSTGRVTSLSFSSTSDVDDPPVIDLNGSIPPSIGDLSELESIYFSGLRRLVGPIPPQLAKLKKLQFLTITGTKVSGPIPSSLSQLTLLKELTLGNNMLTGPIPSSLGSLVNLTNIGLYGNKLSGSIPSSLFASLSKGLLADLDVSENKLSGPIPRSFGNVAFTNVAFQGNRLTGDASVLFGKSKPINQIILAKNKLAFDLTRVEYPVQNLAYIDISHNEIYGSISDQIKEVPNLGYLDVSYNNLCGKIPTGGSFRLFQKQFYAHNRCLCGAPLPAC